MGLEFPRLPACPSPSIRLLVYLFRWVLFSTRVPYLRDGVTPAGSRIVCPRSERRFSVPIWVRFTGRFLDGPHTSVCGVSARPVPQGVLPGVPRCVHELRLSLALSGVLHCPMLGFGVASPTLATGLGLSLVSYPSSCRLGLEPRSVAQLGALLPLAPSFRVVLTEATGLGRFLDLSMVLPCPWVRFQVHLLCTASCQQVVFWAWRLLLRVRLRPLPDDSLGALGLPACLL